MKNALCRWPRLPAAVWLVLALAHALALGHALRTGRYVFPDSDRYVQAAQNLRQHGQLYARPWPAQPPRGQAVQEFTIRPPGYPLLLGALGGRARPPVLLLLFQNGLSVLILAVVLGGWAAGRACPPGAAQWVAALALALSFPAQFIYANALMSEVPLQAVVLLGAGLGVRFWHNGQARYLAGATVAVVAAWLLKPVFFPFTIIFLVVIGWRAWHWRRPALALLGALPLLLAGAYMAWNGHRTGYVHFSSIADINLLHYNASGVVRQTQGPAAEDAWVAAVLRRANAQPTFAARQRVIQSEAGAVLRQHPVRYAGQHALGMATLLLDPGRFDLSNFLGATATPGLLGELRGGGLAGVGAALGRQPLALLLALALVALANLLRLGLALRGLAVAPPGEQPAGWLRLAWPAGRWLAVGLVAYVALLTGPLGAARFLVPVWPLWLALALRGLPEGAADAGKNTAFSD
ncbi:MAG TPA: hypothetical protein VFO93_06765 [Hymenobacter sp.]|uniref:hypothetical protein n=1 Tax=Hymenobacter sp. TaxID=1898978 RepID=UPI002D7E7FE7|nr:hypothetical protein [Hymenobacter sp.]HET9503224.1 hypothetical protein [Hymenobacter sp.]